MINKTSVVARVARVALLGLWLVITLFPLYWIVVTSFKDPGSIAAFPLRYLPSPWSLDNYTTLFTNSSFGT